MSVTMEARSPLFLTIPQAAAELNVSPRTVAARLAAGEIASITIGRRRLIPRAALDAFVSGRMAANTSATAGSAADDAP